MKALSVRAPWWWFILYAGKDIENRDWSTNFRGTIYLHASKWWRLEDVKWDAEDAIVMYRKKSNGFKQEITWPEMKNSGGCLVGTVEIVDCVWESDSPWFSGRYGFVLRNPIVLLKPIPFKGALGFFDVPEAH